MSGKYPRIRVRAEDGSLLLREGLSFNFYMRRPHSEIAQEVIRSLETFLHAVGQQALSRYLDDEGSLRRLDRNKLNMIIQALQAGASPIVQLLDAPESSDQYRFEYHGKSLEVLNAAGNLNAVCAVSFWLPTEYLEKHGPLQVRELALELASSLPFCSGHGGLSFNGEIDLVGVPREIEKRCFLYPGIDIPVSNSETWRLGTRVRGPHWLTFLGQPVLGELGGVAGLRTHLRSASTTVQGLGEDRAAVTLGQWPEAGDVERGQALPGYRELARVLEPWLYEEPHRLLDFSPRDSRRWQRRFLD